MKKISLCHFWAIFPRFAGSTVVRRLFRRPAPFRVLFGNDGEPLLPTVRVLLEIALKGKPFVIAEHRDWVDLTADARQFGFDLLISWFRGAVDSERPAGVLWIDSLVARIDQFRREFGKPILICIAHGFPDKVSRLEEAGADVLLLPINDVNVLAKYVPQ